MPKPLPQLITSAAEIRALVSAARRAKQSVGLVPTMGALHAGHLSLVQAARDECDLVITTIFVNPTQFAPNEDLDRYPRDLDSDCRQLAEIGCDVVFAPATEEMYPEGATTSVDVGSIATVLEGAARPTHFAGVATIVLKLFNLVPADKAYFGQKDYQQTVVLKQMTADLNVPIELVICPIVREADGLAMSSRNAYLTDQERKQAVALSESLQIAADLRVGGEQSAARIKQSMADHLASTELEADYIAMLKPDTVEAVEVINGPIVVGLAVRVGKTRLIDNRLIE